MKPSPSPSAAFMSPFATPRAVSEADTGGASDDLHIDALCCTLSSFQESAAAAQKSSLGRKFQLAHEASECPEPSVSVTAAGGPRRDEIA